jgi:hypothetical protein
VSTTNFVAPDEEAAMRFPELLLFTMSDALLPIPPETERTAGVFEEEPT